MTGSPSTRLLDADLSVHRPAFRLDARITAAPGEIVALLGPNGAGKTTALRALAGLLPLDGGSITLEGMVLDDPSGGVFVSPERRPVGVVFQDYLLFPHLTAIDNVAFGPRCHGASRREARELARGLLSRLGLAGQAGLRPRHLSGGQAQRVALARALAVEPALLLLDEPLAALDARTRVETRTTLRRHLAGFPGATLLVTHDPLEAMAMADRLVILEDGRVVQCGDAAAVTATPRTDYVARLVGLNLYRGTAADRLVTLADGFDLVTTAPAKGAVFVAFPPAAVAVFRDRPTGSPRNCWPATIGGIERSGDQVRLLLTGRVDTAAEVTPAAAADLRLAVGSPVWASLKAAEIRVYPSEDVVRPLDLS